MAQASTSRPSIAGGIVSFWMGVGRVKPISLTPRARSGWSPKLEKGMETVCSFRSGLPSGSCSAHEYSGSCRERRNRRRGLRSFCLARCRELPAPRCRTSRTQGVTSAGQMQPAGISVQGCLLDDPSCLVRDQLPVVLLPHPDPSSANVATVWLPVDCRLYEVKQVNNCRVSIDAHLQLGHVIRLELCTTGLETLDLLDLRA